MPVQFELALGQTLRAEVPLLPEAARAGLRALRQPAQPRSARAGAADLVAGRVRRRARARHRPVLHPGHARGHQGPEDRRADGSRVPAAGADRRRRESSGSTAYVLDRFTDGFLFYYFGNVDQVSHMMWRADGPAAPGLRSRRSIRSTARRRGPLRRSWTPSSATRSRGSARTICSSSCRTTASPRGAARST